MIATQKVPIDVVSLPKQKITELMQSWLTIDEQKLVICMEFYFDDLNENTEVWEDGRYNHIEYHYRKEVVMGIMKWWNRGVDKWMVEIVIDGSENYQIFFSKESRCDEVKNILLNWLWPKKEN